MIFRCNSTAKERRLLLRNCECFIFWLICCVIWLYSQKYLWFKSCLFQFQGHANPVLIYYKQPMKFVVANKYETCFKFYLRSKAGFVFHFCRQTIHKVDIGNSLVSIRSRCWQPLVDIGFNNESTRSINLAHHTETFL